PYPLYANRAQGRQPGIGSVVLGKTSYFVRAQSFQRWSFAKMKIGRLAPQQRSKPFVFGKTLKPRVAELERTLARGFPGELGGFDKAMGGLPARHLGTAKPGEVFSLETTTGLKDVEVLSPRGVSGSAATAFEYLGQTRPRTRGKSETQVVSFQVPKSGTFKARFAPSGLHSFYVIEKATGNQFTARKFTIEIQR
ncbi:MAG: hypothetical protein KJO07_10675, partial [Deltaproteobacteria bacterium]|nr:hypothetical protein [Deltaproteobacteria bacterium]